MRYDLLAQDALRGVVRTALHRVKEQGLPGEHHFYIAFRTDAPGVQISSRLQERYPQEITIVLQHQFWDLNVDEHKFQVCLSFNDIAETLVVPFSAIKGFFDPSVQFGLQFELLDRNDSPGSGDLNPRIGGRIIMPNETLNNETPENDDSDTAPDISPTESADILHLDIFRKKN